MEPRDQMDPLGQKDHRGMVAFQVRMVKMAPKEHEGLREKKESLANQEHL